jgi:hypothetical protein
VDPSTDEGNRCSYRNIVFKVLKTINNEHNKALRRIFGPKRDETIGGWRKLRNEELHNCSHQELLK